MKNIYLIYFFKKLRTQCFVIVQQFITQISQIPRVPVNHQGYQSDGECKYQLATPENEKSESCLILNYFSLLFNVIVEKCKS